jgi:mannitol/fructose-specific phosphotransferase system IIA component
LLKKELPYGDATGLLTWLSEHRFYLSRSVCEKANRIEEARKKMFEEGKINIRFVYAHFEPNQNMSEDYLEE